MTTTPYPQYSLIPMTLKDPHRPHLPIILKIQPIEDIRNINNLFKMILNKTQ